MTSLRNLISSVRAELPATPLARWASVFFSLCVLTMLISLAASQAFLALAAIFYAAHLLRHPTAPRFPPVKLPLALFLLTTLISIFFAENPTVGWVDIRKFVLFLILLLAVNLVVTARHLKWLYGGVFLGAALAGLYGVRQFALQYREVRALHPGQVYSYMTATRITGFMGHWMNFGGQEMLAFAALVAFLLLSGFGVRGSEFGVQHGRSKRPLAMISDADRRPPTPGPRPPSLWWLALAIIALSILLNFTRGVWLGCFVASVYVVSRCRARALWALPVLVAAIYLAAPGLVRDRLNSLRHPAADPSLAMRFEIWHAGLAMIRRHPWVGVGPNNINEVYTLYLPRGYQPEVGYHEHMHNDALQVAAERGLPCLAAWLWFMIALSWRFVKIRQRLARAGQSTWVADAALAGWLAFVAEGFFEFNFGTSPVLMVFLFVISTPFVAEGLWVNERHQ
ncbi:MAG TPA: O-antigen ligase family protein [Terriglobia bacterium]|nr:O-antigen ligase family protein [Terriglobia bacterium]